MPVSLLVSWSSKYQSFGLMVLTTAREWKVSALLIVPLVFFDSVVATIFFQLHVLPPEWLAVEFTHFCGFFGLDHLIFIRHLYFLIFVHKFAFFIALKYSLKSPGMAALISSHVNWLVQPFPRDPGGRCCSARYFYPIKCTKCSIKNRSMSGKKINFVTKYSKKIPFTDVFYTTNAQVLYLIILARLKGKESMWMAILTIDTPNPFKRLFFLMFNQT